jgi:hypothetical protein
MIVECGLYILSDQYFKDFPDDHHMWNKYESRPYYVAIKQDNGIIWLVPLSSQVEKYRQAIARDEQKYGSCIFQYTTYLKGKETVFLIGDAIPVTEKYILRSFSVNGVPFVIQDREDIKQIHSKLSRFLALVLRKRLKPYVDIFSIEHALLTRS